FLALRRGGRGRLYLQHDAQVARGASGYPGCVRRLWSEDDALNLLRTQLFRAEKQVHGGRGIQDDRRSRTHRNVGLGGGGIGMSAGQVKTRVQQLATRPHFKAQRAYAAGARGSTPTDDLSSLYTLSGSG